MRGPAAPPRPRRLLLLAVAALLASMAAARGVGLARGEFLTAGDEIHWYGWAQREPALAAALVDAAARLPHGARVELVVPPAADRRWLELMAFYHLPAAWPVGVRPRGTPPPRAVREGRAGVTHRVHLLPDGTAGIRPLAQVRPPAAPGPPPPDGR